MESAPAGTVTMQNYRFPVHRLKSEMKNPDRTPLVLIACGSFSPITFLHLRMFEMAAGVFQLHLLPICKQPVADPPCPDYARFNTNYEVVGAYLSAVGDAYKKSGLAKAEHRLNMCGLAVDQSSWISGTSHLLLA